MSFRRIIHRLPVDLHRPAQRLLYLCWDGHEEMGGEVPVTAWPGRRSFSSHSWFVYSRSSATCLACSSCLASSSWRQRRSWSSGAKFTGFLVMMLNSDGPVGCLGVAKVLQIGGGHLRASVPKLSRTVFVTSCLVFPTNGANCGVLIPQSHWIVKVFIS